MKWLNELTPSSLSLSPFFPLFSSRHGSRARRWTSSRFELRAFSGEGREAQLSVGRRGSPQEDAAPRRGLEAVRGRRRWVRASVLGNGGQNARGQRGAHHFELTFRFRHFVCTAVWALSSLLGKPMQCRKLEEFFVIKRGTGSFDVWLSALNHFPIALSKHWLHHGSEITFCLFFQKFSTSKFIVLW